MKRTFLKYLFQNFINREYLTALFDICETLFEQKRAMCFSCLWNSCGPFATLFVSGWEF